MNNWKNILKVDKERWERYQAARKKAHKTNEKTSERKPTQPRFKCAMCGIKLSRYDNKEHKRGELNYCSTCKKNKEAKE